MRPSYQQRGVALITALLIVALATIISVRISTQLQLDVRRTGNILSNEQAMLYNLEAEAWSRRILEKDRKDNNIDHLDENWAIEIPPLPVEGGTIRGKLTDMQACININTLAASGVTGSVAQDRFKQLLVNQGLNSNLVQAVVDWIDADLETLIPDGAEDGHYMNLKPYRTANTPLLSVSELRLIKGFEKNEVYEKLSPWLCAIDAPTAINVNTAPVEVLKSLSSDITDRDAEAIITQREDDPFDDMTEFLNFNDLKSKILKTDHLSVSTDYFLLETEARIGQSRTLMYSLIQRDGGGNTEVNSRTQGTH